MAHPLIADPSPGGSPPGPTPRIVLRVAIALVALLAGSGRADEFPTIRRVHVPSDRQASAFPPGTELKTMGAEEFDRLVAAARAAEDRPASPAPSLVRARHQARWEGGVLVGESELLVSETPADAGSILVLDPWSAAITDDFGPESPLRVASDQRLGIARGPSSPRSVILHWEQASRAGTSGRAFDLALPAIAACRLALDLPAEVVPEIAGMLRHDPEPGPSPSRRRWRFEGPGGVARLRILPESDPGGGRSAWVAGPTTIDATRSPMRLTADWVLSGAPSGPGPLIIELDADLDLLDVTGPAVESFRALPEASGEASGGDRYAIRLEDSAASPGTVKIRAIARPPRDGPWKLPSVRPLRAHWTGGRTLVRLGPSHQVLDVRELAGSQVAPTPSEAADATAEGASVLAFEAAAAGPVAEILLRNSAVEAAAEVRGWVTLGLRDQARMEASIAYRFDRGRPLGFAVDLPSGWTPEQSLIRGSADPVSWHAEARPEGGTRVTVRPATEPAPGSQVTLDLSALAANPDRFGPIDLPRVTPLGVRVTDELWGVRCDPGISARPTRARGLAWLDPDLIGAVADRPAANDPARPILGWRWTSADGRGTLQRDPAAPRREIQAWVVAEASRSRLGLDYYVVTDRGAPESSDLHVASSALHPEPLAWEMLGEARRPIESRVVPSAAGSGTAWRLAVPRIGADRVVLHARSERPRVDGGAIPLLSVREEGGMEGRLVVKVHDDLLARMEAPGLSPLEPRWALKAADGFSGASDPAGSGAATASTARPAFAFRYGRSAAPPSLTAQAMTPVSPAGAVRDATLATRSDGGDLALNHLSLLVIPPADRGLAVTLPGAAILDRAEVDGKPVTPARIGADLRLDVPSAGDPSGLVEVVLAYRSPLDQVVPGVSLPVLHFLWIADGGEDVRLRPTDPTWKTYEEIEGPARDRFASPAPPPPGPSPGRGEASPGPGLDLGTWLDTLDAEGPPIVVDREGLAASGLGPGTPLDDAPLDGPPRARVAILDALGLVLAPGPGCLLLRPVMPSATGRAVAGGTGEGDLAERLRLALRIGHDEVDRYQSLVRWRTEATPRGPSRPAGLATARGSATVRRFYASTTSPRAGGGLVASRASGQSWSGLVMAPLLLAAMVAIAGRRPSSRVALVAIALPAGLAWLRFGPVGNSAMASAVVYASLAFAAIDLALACRERRREDAPPSRSTIPRAAVVALAIAAAIRPGFAQEPESPPPPAPASEASSPPILVVAPYDPPFDPDRAPARVVLSLSDYEGLRRRAAPPAIDEGPARLANALHEARRDGPDDVRLASAFDLQTSAAGGSWTFPVEGTREIEATLDGRPVPIRINAGSRTASVDVPGAGAHRLILKRLATLRKSDGTERLSVPIPPIASARLRVDLGAAPNRPVAATARGRSEARGNILDVVLGPAKALDLTWTSPTSTGPPRPRGEVAVLGLWDIDPAGDRLRLRVASASTDGLKGLSLRLDPGLVVRSASTPSGPVDVSVLELADGASAEMRFDPPLEEGETLDLDLWSPERPRSPGVAGCPASPCSDRPSPRPSTACAGPRTGRAGSGPAPDSRSSRTIASPRPGGNCRPRPGPWPAPRGSDRARPWSCSPGRDDRPGGSDPRRP